MSWFLITSDIGKRTPVCAPLLNKHHVTLPHFLSPLRVGIAFLKKTLLRYNFLQEHLSNDHLLILNNGSLSSLRNVVPHLKHSDGYVRAGQLRRLIKFLLEAFTTLLELFVLAVTQHMWVFCDN